MKYLYLLLVVCCCVWHKAFSQCQPRQFFTANQAGQPDSVFCVGDLVLARFCPGTTGVDIATVTYNFTEDNFLNSRPDSQHVYSAPGVYTIYQYVSPTCPGCTSYQVGPVRVRVLQLPPPQFTVKPCFSNQANITSTDANYDRFEVNWGDATAATTFNRGQSRNHTYANPGSAPFTITVTGTNILSGCTGTSTFSFTPADAAAVIDSVVLNNLNAQGRVQLYFPITAGFTYILYNRIPPATAFTPFDTLRPVSTRDTLYNAPANTTQAVCYQIKALDACGSTARTSPEICTLPLTATAASGQNNLSWIRYAGPASSVQRLQLLRNRIPLANPTVSQSSFTDPDVVCGVEYCYRLVAELSGNRRSVSNVPCVIGTSTQAPAAPYLEASFNLENTIGLQIKRTDNSTLAQLLPERNRNATGYLPLPPGTSDQYTDADTAATDSSYCYRVTFLDSCSNKSPVSNIACVMILRGELLEGSSGQEAALRWNPYRGFSGTVRSYELELLDEQGNVAQTLTFPPRLSYRHTPLPTDLQLLRYRVKASSSVAGEGPVYSNIIELQQELKFGIPNAFSPNGDGRNDLFAVKGYFFRTFSLKIVNRSGQIVFSTTDQSQGWDGTFNGRQCPIDGYVYQLTVVDFTGQRIQCTGSLTLLR